MAGGGDGGGSGGGGGGDSGGEGGGACYRKMLIVMFICPRSPNARCNSSVIILAL